MLAWQRVALLMAVRRTKVHARAWGQGPHLRRDGRQFKPQRSLHGVDDSGRRRPGGKRERQSVMADGEVRIPGAVGIDRGGNEAGGTDRLGMRRPQMRLKVVRQRLNKGRPNVVQPRGPFGGQKPTSLR